jgi:ribosomal protein S18 acetylase RimI-like enzyme
MASATDAWHIRAAGAADAEALARFGAECFRAAYGADSRPEDVEAHVLEHYSPARQGREIANPDGVFLMAWAGDAIAGYAYLRQVPPPPCVSSRRRMEINRFYLAPETHGRGLAQRLMAAALAAAAERGAEGVWLTVWERNPRGIAFYRKSGFRDVGETVFQVGADPQRDRVMELPPGAFTG